MVPDTSISNNFVSEYHKSKIVNIFTIILLHVNPVHVHENVSDHNHTSLVIIPGRIQGLKKIVVEGLEDIIPDLAF